MPRPCPRREIAFRVRLAVAAALASLFASATPVGATRGPSLRARDLTAANGKVWFLQSDGKGTTIDLATGAVARGGDRHDQWPSPPRCDMVTGACRLPARMLTLQSYDEGEGAVLAMKSEAHQWQVVQRRSPRGRPPWWAWEVGGTLLLESPDWGISTLECLDIATGRARWIYAYPTPYPSMAWTPMGVRESASAMRDALQHFEGAARQGSVGSYPAADAGSDRSYAGAVVVDPDPLRAGTVRAGLLLGWAAVVVALALAAMRAMGRPAGAHFTALAIGLALVIVAVGLIDPLLVGALWLLLLGAVAAAGKGAPRGLLLVVVLVTAVIVSLPSFMDSIQR